MEMKQLGLNLVLMWVPASIAGRDLNHCPTVPSSKLAS